MDKVIIFLKTVGFEIVNKKPKSFRALYFAKGINLYVDYKDPTTGIWYDYHLKERRILDDSLLENVEALQFVLSRNVYIKNEFPYLMKKINEYKL